MTGTGRVLSSADPEPPVGTWVRDAYGTLYERTPVCWSPREDDGTPYNGDAETWTAVAGNYGPVAVVTAPASGLSPKDGIDVAMTPAMTGRSWSFDSTVNSDGVWHTVCREKPDAFGEGNTAQDAYEAARFALDTLLLDAADASRPTPASPDGGESRG